MERGEYVSFRDKVTISSRPKRKRGFLKTLYEILEDQNNANIISWSSDGSSVVLKGHAKAFESLLIKYFPHSKYESFIRQLSFYGFKRLEKASKLEKTRIYQLPNFSKGRIELLDSIKRKGVKESLLASNPEQSLQPDYASYSYHHKMILTELESAYRTFEKLQHENKMLQSIVGRYRAEVPRTDSNIRIEAPKQNYTIPYQTPPNQYANHRAFQPADLKSYRDNGGVNISDHTRRNTQNPTMMPQFHAVTGVAPNYIPSQNYLTPQFTNQGSGQELPFKDGSVSEEVFPAQSSKQNIYEENFFNF